MRLLLTGFLASFALLVVSGCITDDKTEPTAEISATSTTAPPPSPTPTSGPTPTATYTAALDAILIPGPSLPAPADFFFQNGADIWRQPAEGDARAATTDLNLGPWAQTPDGMKAAIVVYRESDGLETEEIRIIQPDLTITDPVYSQDITADGAEPASIQSLSWAWDGAALAVGFNDGTATLLRNLLDPAAGVTTSAVAIPATDRTLGPVLMAPNGAGVAFLLYDDDERGSLYIAPSGDVARPVFANAGDARSVRAFDWLAGRGRLVFVEQPAASPSGAPGSIFTIAPDGTSLELLVSSGQFAPAASVALIAPSPDGRQIAFTVHIPNVNGDLEFQSLWIHTIDSGERVEMSVEPGYRVTDLWWTAAGLCWRGVDLGARSSASSSAYQGTEPFIIGRSNIESGESSVFFRSNRRAR